MTTKILAAVAAGLAAISLAVALGRGGTSQATPQRVAGEYVKGIAKQAGATILGDKVWAVRRNGPVTTVVIRVKFSVQMTLFGRPIGPPQVGYTTVFVRLMRSGYTVLP